jgi:hypothetical protein
VVNLERTAFTCAFCRPVLLPDRIIDQVGRQLVAPDLLRRLRWLRG